MTAPRTTRRLILAAIGMLLLVGNGPLRAADEDGVSTITKPERTAGAIDAAYATIPPVRVSFPTDRWDTFPRTAAVLRAGKGTLRVVMLGDSIVNDTSRSGWDEVVRRTYPNVALTKVTVVRGSTGCWWYREAGRVARYVLPHEPDLLIIGGISQRDDVESIREVVRQVRAAGPCDVLLMTGAFGAVDPNDDARWSETIPDDPEDYRFRLRALASEIDAAFLDMTALWGRHVRDSGRPVAAFQRDVVHANEPGEQILGRILAAYFLPDAP